MLSLCKVNKLWSRTRQILVSRPREHLFCVYLFVFLPCISSSTGHLLFMKGTILIACDVAKSERQLEYRYVVYTKKSNNRDVDIFEELADHGASGVVSRVLEIPQGFVKPCGKYVFFMK